MLFEQIIVRVRDPHLPVSVLAGLTSAFSEVADRNPDSRLCELCSVLLVLLLPPLPLLDPPPAMTEGRLF